MTEIQQNSTDRVHRKGKLGEEYELEEYGNSTTEPRVVAAPAVDVADITPLEVEVEYRFWLGLPRPSHIHYVPAKAGRDHLANERVFLGYVRTGSALANFAITILQLYRLKHDPAPKDELSDYDLGIPLASTTLFLAIAITIAGTWRFFACQSAMARKQQIITSSGVVLVFIPALIMVSPSQLSQLMDTCN